MERARQSWPRQQPDFNLTADQIFDPRAGRSLQVEKSSPYQYEPGSTLKTVGQSTALDEAWSRRGRHHSDAGQVVVAGPRHSNWKWRGDGISSMTDVLIHSSKRWQTWVSGVLGPDRLMTTTRYGFGQPTGCAYRRGRRPCAPNHDPGWTRIDQATNAYGQGIAVTPVHSLQAVAVFANDGQLVRRGWFARLADRRGTRDRTGGRRR